LPVCALAKKKKREKGTTNLQLGRAKISRLKASRNILFAKIFAFFKISQKFLTQSTLRILDFVQLFHALISSVVFSSLCSSFSLLFFCLPCPRPSRTLRRGYLALLPLEIFGSVLTSLTSDVTGAFSHCRHFRLIVLELVLANLRTYCFVPSTHLSGCLR